jgi:hypothetical protein
VDFSLSSVAFRLAMTLDNVHVQHFINNSTGTVVSQMSKQ